jgi:hypothetical protein
MIGTWQCVPPQRIFAPLEQRVHDSNLVDEAAYILDSVMALYLGSLERVSIPAKLA